MQHTPPYALVLVLARGTLCRCQGAYCSEVTVVHAADRSGPMCTPIGADDGREKSAPQTRSQRYHAWCALSVARPARTQAGCAPAVGSPKRNYNCTGHKLPLSCSGASTTRGREKQRRGRIHWPPKHRFLATLQHSGAYRRTCTTPPVARPACGAPACFFFLPPPAACVCIKRGNKRKKKNGNLNPANAPPHKHPHNARHTHAPLSCVLSYPGTIASHAACENVAQRCARCPVAGPPVSTAFSCRATGWPGVRPRLSVGTPVPLPPSSSCCAYGDLLEHLAAAAWAYGRAYVYVRYALFVLLFCATIPARTMPSQHIHARPCPVLFRLTPQKRPLGLPW